MKVWVPQDAKRALFEHTKGLKMSFNSKYGLLIATGVAAGAACVMIWCKYDRSHDEPLSRLDQNSQMLPNEFGNEPKLLDSISLDGARQLEPLLPTEMQNVADDVASLVENTNSALLTSGIQSKDNKIASLVDLDDNEFVLPPAQDNFELTPEIQDAADLPAVENTEDFAIQSGDEAMEFEIDQLGAEQFGAGRLSPSTTQKSVPNLQQSVQQPVEHGQANSPATGKLPAGWRSNPFFTQQGLPKPAKAAAQPKPVVNPNLVATVNIDKGFDNQAPTATVAQLPPSTRPTTETVLPSKPVMLPPLQSGLSVMQSGPIGMQDESILPIQVGISEAVAQQAVHHIEYGKSLARRGAAFAARQEFFKALRIVAQANDTATGGNNYSKALTDAIRAMREAEEFKVENSDSGEYVDVAATVETHQTKILTEQEAKLISPTQAMQAYYGFARQQLDYASGRNVVTAEALHSLGKLHTVMARHKKTMPGNLDVAKAIVFHKASLLSNPQNPSSANELGVLLAKTGNLHQATELFKQSLIEQPSPQAWNNLARTHRRLGEVEMAQLAETELAMAGRSQPTVATAGIQWMQNQDFNAMTPLEFEPRVATNKPIAIPEIKSAEEDSSETKGKSLGERFKSLKSWF